MTESRRQRLDFLIGSGRLRDILERAAPGVEEDVIDLVVGRMFSILRTSTTETP